MIRFVRLIQAFLTSAVKKTKIQAQSSSQERKKNLKLWEVFPVKQEKTQIKLFLRGLIFTNCIVKSFSIQEQSQFLEFFKKTNK